jgi:hypothetical protein
MFDNSSRRLLYRKRGQQGHPRPLRRGVGGRPAYIKSVGPSPTFGGHAPQKRAQCPISRNVSAQKRHVHIMIERMGVIRHTGMWDDSVGINQMIKVVAIDGHRRVAA